MGKSVDVCCYRRVLARSLVHTDILHHTGGVPGLSNSPSRESGKENPTKIKRAELQNKKIGSTNYLLFCFFSSFLSQSSLGGATPVHL